MSHKKSLAERELNNNPGWQSMVPAPRVTPGEPDVPDQIITCEFGRAEWFRVTSILRDEGRLSQFDGGMILVACQAFELMQKAWAAIGGEVMIESRDRGLVKNPAVQVFRDSFDSYKRGCEMLGVQPSSREVAKVEKDSDPFGQLG